MAITSVATLNTYLGEVDVTAAKTAAVNSANQLVEQYTGRIFDSTVRQEWYKLENQSQLMLDYRPIQYVHRVLAGCTEALRVYCPNDLEVAIGVPVTSAQVSIADGEFNICPYVLGGYLQGAAFTLNAYNNLAEVEAELEAVDIGWVAEVVEECGPTRLIPTISEDCIEPNTLSLYAATDAIEAVVEDSGAGILRFPGRSSGYVQVSYSAGYNTVPVGLTQIATEIAAQMLKSPDVNLALQSEKIGDYSYTTKTGGGSTSGGNAIIDHYGPMLDLYRGVTL